MISTVIPVHNRFEFLSDTLASVFSQSMLSDEVLLVDNGSTLNLEIYLQKNPPPGPVRVLRIDPPVHVGEARNVGWRNTQGDLIAFNDSDDLWEPDKTRMQARYLELHSEVDGVYGPMQAFFPDGRTEPWADDRPPEVDLASALLDANMTVQTLMIRREALERLGGFDQTLPILEDQAFAVEIALSTLRVVFLPGRFVTQLRRNNQNITRNALLYFVCDCRIALRYRHLSAEVFGPGSVRIHLCRSLRRFGKRSRGMGMLTRNFCRIVEGLSPDSDMPRGG